MASKNIYPKVLLVSFTLFWIVISINPVNRFNWLIENLLIFTFLPIIIILYRKFSLSNISLTMIFLFSCLHLIGAHYSYNIPFEVFIGDEKNYYDRFVHFAFGLLLVYPLRELLIKVTNAKSFWSHYIPIHLVLSLSAIYEILEYLTAMVIDPQAADVFVGTNGDVFDATKDMLLALFGSLFTTAVTLVTNKK